jgi:hypothetical protein
MLSKREILKSVIGKSVAIFQHLEYGQIVINMNPGASNYPHQITQVGEDIFETIGSINQKKTYYSISHIFMIQQG